MQTFGKHTPGLDVAKAYASAVKGKTILITGSSEGTIGGQTALDLASVEPTEILLAGRSLSKIQPVIDAIHHNYTSVKTKFVHLDLADLDSVRKTAQEVNNNVEKLDILINNAGVMAVKDYTHTKDGIELQFGANHVGHFLLTNLLVPKIVAARGRIVNVSSLGYMSGGIHFDDPNFSNGTTYNPWIAYAQSKTANILFTRSLAAKLKSKGVKAYVLNPGFVTESKLMTNVTQDMFNDGYAITLAALGDKPMPAAAMQPKSLAASSSTTIYAGFSPELDDHSGAFLCDAKIFEEPLLPHATSNEDAERLWELSEKLIGEKFVL